MKVPNWLKENIKRFRCPICDEKMDEDNVYSFGWRVNEKDPEKDFFVDYSCSQCERKIVIPLSDMDLEAFAMKVMEETIDEEELLNDEEDFDFDSGAPEDYQKQNPDNPQAKKRKPRSKIHDDEVDRIKSFMKDHDFSTGKYDDFLKQIGLTEDKIKEIYDNNKED